MQLYAIDHVYKVCPPGYEDTDLKIHMTVIPQKEFDQSAIEQRGLSPEKVSEKTIELICSKIVKVEGFPGVTTGRELYEKGHPDIWGFVQRAVFSARMLSAAEVKN